MEGGLDEAGSLAPPTRVRHINKRTLKNKGLSVTFNEKDLRDFVTGFHKRKKKRRKEAQKQQEEALRRKRIEARKKRKLERELVLNAGEEPASTSMPGEDEESEEVEGEPAASVSGTMLYDTGGMKVTVTTSEISREEEEEEAFGRERAQPTVLRSTGASTDKKQSVPVRKTKSFKKAWKHKSRAKPHGKRDKKKRSKQNKKSR